MKLILSILTLSLLLSGCASYNICDRGGHTLVDIQNTSWSLFHCIPIASGNINNPNKFSSRLFRDTVTLEGNMKLLEKAMNESEAAGVKNVTSYTTDESILFILMTRHACHTSAELTFSNEKQPKDNL